MNYLAGYGLGRFFIEWIRTDSLYWPGTRIAVSQVVSASCPKTVVNLSLPDAPVITGTSKEVFDYYGMNAEGIAAKAKEILK